MSLRKILGGLVAVAFVCLLLVGLIHSLKAPSEKEDHVRSLPRSSRRLPLPSSRISKRDPIANEAVDLWRQGRLSEVHSLIAAEGSKSADPAQVAEIYRTIAEEVSRENGPEAAVEILRGGVEKNPDNRELRTDLGLALLEAGKTGEAESLFQKQLEQDPKDAEALFGMGAVSAAKGDIDGAEKYFQYNLSLNPDHLDSKFNLAEIYAFDQKKNFPEAEAYYQDILQKVSGNLDAQNGLAAVYLQSGRNEEAVQLWKEMAEASPEQSVILSNLSEAQFKSGNFKEASQAADQAIGNDPENATAYWYKAMAEKELNHEALYRQYYQEAVSRDPRLQQMAP